MLETGVIVAVKGVCEKMREDREFRKFIDESLDRYRSCDWGDTDKEDAKENDEAVKHNYRVVAKYKHKYDDVFITTECNRAATTVIFASDY